jgi:hypothetical protein
VRTFRDFGTDDVCHHEGAPRSEHTPDFTENSPGVFEMMDRKTGYDGVEAPILKREFGRASLIEYHIAGIGVRASLPSFVHHVRRQIERDDFACT